MGVPSVSLNSLTLVHTEGIERPLVFSGVALFLSPRLLPHLKNGDSIIVAHEAVVKVK